MSKRLEGPAVPNAKKPMKETCSPNGEMPADMKADAEARAAGHAPLDEQYGMYKHGHMVR